MFTGFYLQLTLIKRQTAAAIIIIASPRISATNRHTPFLSIFPGNMFVCRDIGFLCIVYGLPGRLFGGSDSNHLEMDLLSSVSEFLFNATNRSGSSIASTHSVEVCNFKEVSRYQIPSALLCNIKKNYIAMHFRFSVALGIDNHLH